MSKNITETGITLRMHKIKVSNESQIQKQVCKSGKDTFKSSEVKFICTFVIQGHRPKYIYIIKYDITSCVTMLF